MLPALALLLALLFLAAAAIQGAGTPGVQAAATQAGKQGSLPHDDCGMNDVPPGSAFYPFVADLLTRGAISGYADCTFRPFNTITRGQIAKVLVLSSAFALLNPAQGHFSDVPIGSPFYVFVETAYAHSFLSGYGDGTFRPAVNVTRGQLAKMVTLSQGWPLAHPPTPTFADVPANNPFSAFIETAYQQRVISGYQCGDGCLQFHPLATATRGQGAKIISLATGYTPGTPAPTWTAGPAATVAPTGTTGAANVTVHIDRSLPAAISRLAPGVTHEHYSLNPVGNPTAVAAGRALLAASTTYQNQHIMGFGVGNPEAAPSIYNWSDLDYRVQLMRDTGGTPVITLCCAPDWMKGGAPGTTDWTRLEVAPYTNHYADFAELARQVALRYPDVHYFQVWNELKGFWNATLNRWDYESYTTLYNVVYDAVKAANPAANVGGPYLVMESCSDPNTMSNPSNVRGPYGTLDQRELDVITYWLGHKHGADFITLDAGTDNKDGIQLVDDFMATQKFVDVATWVHQQTVLPLWWAEWHTLSGPTVNYTHDHQNAIMAVALLGMVQSGVAVPLRWQPEGTAGQPYDGDEESIWSDTLIAGGGQPFPYYYTQKAFHDFFGPGTQLYTANSSSTQVRVLASATKTLLVNTAATPVTVNVDGTLLNLAGYEVRVR